MALRRRGKYCPLCWFNETKVYEGLEHLRAYSREWDERAQTFKNKPKHDNHSHASDSFRYLSLVAKRSAGRMVTTGMPTEIVTDAEKKLYYQFTLDELWDCQPTQSTRIG